MRDLVEACRGLKVSEEWRGGLDVGLVQCSWLANSPILLSVYTSAFLPSLPLCVCVQLRDVRLPNNKVLTIVYLESEVTFTEKLVVEWK